MLKRTLLLTATMLMAGSVAVACDDDDTEQIEDAIDTVRTEVIEGVTEVTGEVTEITQDNTMTPDECPTIAPDATPDATVPDECITPAASGGRDATTTP